MSSSRLTLPIILTPAEKPTGAAKMALYSVEVRDHNTGELVDWARNLSPEEADDVAEEMEGIWQDDPVDVQVVEQVR